MFVQFIWSNSLIATNCLLFLRRSAGPTTIDDVRKRAVLFRLVYAVSSQLHQWDFNWICDARFGCWIIGSACRYIPRWNMVREILENELKIPQTFHFFHSSSSEPSTRGVLLGFTMICTTAGMLTIYIMNTMMAWRTVAMMCSVVPVISAITIYFVSLQSKIYQIFSRDKIKFSIKISSSDPRNAAMVALQKSNQWSGKIVVMASWLDIASSHHPRIQWFATAQRTIEVMSTVCKIPFTMLTSVANDTRKICRIEAQTNTETVDHRSVAIFPCSIHRHVFDATVHCTDFQSIRQPNRTRQSGNDNECTRQFDQCDVHVLGTIYWQAASVPNNAVRNVCLCHGYDRLWIFNSAERLLFIWSSAILCHWFGEQTFDVHSID